LNRQGVIESTTRYVRDELCTDSSGHDWWHVERVRKLALALGRKESADRYIVELAALLHDISDYKLNGGDLRKGQKVANDWLLSQGESPACADAVADIVARMSFKGAGVISSMPTIEGRVVQDADRLDALEAIGVARAFAYGGFAGQMMHDPLLEPRLHATHEEYLRRNRTTINHFYEKLFLLKDRMNTDSAKRVAEKRHEFLKEFLDEFLVEWDALDLNDEDPPDD
jgi:uncharacterized protein